MAFGMDKVTKELGLKFDILIAKLDEILQELKKRPPA